MTIETTEFANVSISVSPTGQSSGNFGILGFLHLDNDGAVAGKEITATERARSYKGLPSVLGDWSTSSEVYASASAFYGQTPTPTDFTVVMSYSTAQSGALVGGGSDTLDELKAITTGTLIASLDGVTDDISLTGLDFSTAADFDAVAAKITTSLTTAVNAATCVHNGYQFVITSDATGTSSAVGFATGSTADALGLSQINARSEVGIVAEKPVESLGVALAAGIKLVGLDIHKSLRDKLVGEESSTVNSSLEFATFCESAKLIFMHATNDLTVLNSTTNHVAKEVKDGTFRYTLTTFSRNTNLYPGSAIFGRAASVNFSAVGTTITLNLKQMAGISAEDLTPGEFAKLRSNFCSAVVQIGNTVNAFTDSRMSSGTWLDTTHGLMWLENRIEVDMFNALYLTNNKIPGTQTGINTTVATLERSLQAAVRNGLCAPGFLPDGTYLPEGFIVSSVPLADTPSSDKSNRIYQGLSFKMVGAGALHEVLISGEFTE